MTAPTIVGILELPDHFMGSNEQRRAIAMLVNSRFPFEVDTDFQMARRPFQAVFYKTQQCPTVVPFADWCAEIEKCKTGEVFIGLDRKHQPYKSSFLTDDPHWGFEVASRRGKSTFLSLTIAQILHQDPEATATGIDVKRESFKALFGVPRFTLSNNPRDLQDMWDKIKAVRIEMDSRCDARGLDASLDFPFNILAIDEVSQFSAQTDAIWKEVRPQGAPAIAPVWRDIAAIMWQGAAFHCHIILAGQRLDERITGGFGLIGSMGFRGLAGFRKQNWERLIGTYPIPRSRPERGRWIYSDGEHETWVQNVWATDEEIKQYAMSLRPQAAKIDPPIDPVISGVQWINGMDEAAKHLDITKEAFKKRRQRHPIPGNSGTRWTTDELERWAEESVNA